MLESVARSAASRGVPVRVQNSQYSVASSNYWPGNSAAQADQIQAGANGNASASAA